MDKFQAFTVTHKQFKTNELGKLLPDFSTSTFDYIAHLKNLKKEFGWNELFFLNTCNRILFVVHTEENLDLGKVESIYKSFHPSMQDQDLSSFVSGSQILKGREAVSHLFRVASSVDSLVVGEREILAQLKEAYKTCSEAGLCGDNLRMLVEKTINVAKKVYRETKIGENPVSVVALSIRKILSFDPPKDARFLLVGAGQTMQLASKYLKKYGFTNFKIFNRSEENARRIAKYLDAKTDKLENLKHHQDGFDVLVTATSSKKVIIDEVLFETLNRNDDAKKIVVDLSVPSNIAPSISSKDNVHFIDIDRLEKLVKENLSLRQGEVVFAEEIIAAQTAAFYPLLKRRKVERAMGEIPKRIKEIKHHALEEVFAKDIAGMDASSKETLQKVVDYLEKKYIGIPISIAKKALEQGLEEETNT